MTQGFWGALKPPLILVPGPKNLHLLGKLGPLVLTNCQWPNVGTGLRQGCGADRRRPKFTWYTSSTSSAFKGRIRPEIVSIVTSF